MARKSPAQDAVARQIEFSPIGRTRVQVTFDEPELSSDGGALLLREAARINGIIPAMAAALRDGRRQSHVTHSHEELLAERIALICHGYEDANDCDRLRDDAAFRVAAECVPGTSALASQPTMTRFENNVGRRDLIGLFYAFLDSYAKAPECMTIDMDPTVNRVYGDQQHKCFLKSSRTSCTSAEANQFRLFLHSAAYVIMHGLRETVLKGTGMATATFDTIRLRLLKVAARVQTGRTFVRFHLPVACPAAAAFGRTAALASAVRVT